MTSLVWEMTPNSQGVNIHMLIAIVRGGISSLIAEVSEDHIRLHMLSSGKHGSAP